jgi:tripartite-type tricarboxylate transporter receptor subunit TctC
MNITRRTLTAAAAMYALGAAAPASAQFYPSAGPVRVLVGFPPGTSTDVVARILAAKLQASMNQAVVVENRSGGAAFVAAQELARAAPNGYTLMLGPMPTITIAPATNPNLSWDPLRDFTPVGAVADSDLMLVINPKQAPASSVAEFINWARRQQRPPFLGTLGAGTLGHFAGVLLGETANLKMESVHYRTTGEAFTGMVNGDVHAMVVATSVAAPHVHAGTLRALASTGRVRSVALPEVPTFREAGYPNLEFFLWYGVFAPAKTPADVLDRLNTAITDAVRDPGVRTKLEGAGFRAIDTTREDFSRVVRTDAERWARVVKNSGFKTQN